MMHPISVSLASCLSQALIVLGLATAALVAAAWVLGRFHRSGRHDRRIWRTAVMGMLTVCAIEFLGLDAGLIETARYAGRPLPVLNDGELGGSAILASPGSGHASANSNGSHGGFRPIDEPTGESTETGGRTAELLRATMDDQDLLADIIRSRRGGNWHGTASSPADTQRAAGSDLASWSDRLPNRVEPSGGERFAAWKVDEAVEVDSRRLRRFRDRLAAGVAVVWFLGALAIWFRHGWQCAKLHRLCGALAPVTDTALRSRVAQLSSCTAAPGTIRIVQSEQLSAPITFGIFKPTLVLPQQFSAEFDADQQSAMLTHELSHLGGRDSLWQLLSVSACGLLWWHPLAWYAAHRLRLAMEFAADEATLLVPCGPSHLAECLVATGRKLAGGPRHALGMAGPQFQSALGLRVERLLELTRHPRSAAFRRRRGQLFVCECPILLTLAASVLVSGWAFPSLSFNQGDSQMERFHRSWRSSLAATLVVGFLLPMSTHAQESADSIDADIVRSDDDEPLRADDEIVIDREIEISDSEPRERRERIRVPRREGGSPRGVEVRERARREAIRTEREESERARNRQREEIERAVRELELKADELSERYGPDHPEVRQATERLRAEVSERLRDLEAQQRAERREYEARRRELDARRREQQLRLHEFRLHREESRGGRSEEQERRRMHLREAIENLRAAGLAEQAERLERASDELLGADRVHEHDEGSDLHRRPADDPGRRPTDRPPRADAARRPLPALAPAERPMPPARPRVAAPPRVENPFLQRRGPSREVAELREELDSVRTDMQEMRGMLRELLEHQRRADADN